MNISIFSPLWFILVLIVIAAAFLLGKKLRTLDMSARLSFLEKLSIFTLLYWVLYKVFMSQDPTYNFRIFNELPLHLCNIGTMASIVAARKNNKALQCFLFYWILIGSALACVTPDPDFVNVSLLLPRCLGYWGYHMLMVMLPLVYVAGGVYRPRYRDIPVASAVVIAAGVCTFVINLILRATVFPEANYCYSFGMPGNPLADMLQKYVPIPVVYILPMVPLVMLLNAGMCALARLLSREK